MIVAPTIQFFVSISQEGRFSAVAETLENSESLYGCGIDHAGFGKFQIIPDKLLPETEQERKRLKCGVQGEPFRTACGIGSDLVYRDSPPPACHISLTERDLRKFAVFSIPH